MKLIEVGGRNSGFAKVDDEDYPALRKHSWHSNRGYARRKNQHNGQTLQVSMHRIVMKAKKGQIVDHINHDRLDNRKQNLRFVTSQENSANHSLNTWTKIGLKGVAQCPRSKSFYSRIFSKGKYKYLGTFTTAKEAHNAYLDAYNKLQRNISNSSSC